MSVAQRLSRIPPRPASAIEYRSDQAMTGLQMESSSSQPGPPPVSLGSLSIFSSGRDDIEMEDATSVPTGPSTAPLQASGPTFFHDDVNDGLD
jgi:F-box and WD-40 domain protein CDC4